MSAGWIVCLDSGRVLAVAVGHGPTKEIAEQCAQRVLRAKQAEAREQGWSLPEGPYTVRVIPPTRGVPA